MIALLAVALLDAGPMATPVSGEEPGAWLVYNGIFQFTDHWNVFTETQLRLIEGASHPEDAFIRVSPQYDFTPEAMAGLGYLHGKVWEQSADGERIENRLSGQFGLRQTWNHTVFEHRYRVEQRWFRWENGRTATRNRARYRLQVTVPLIRAGRDSGTIFLNASDEIFADFGNRRGLDQNRFYVAGGYRFSRLTNVQLGYMWIATEAVDRHRLWLFLTRNFDFR